MKKNLLLKVSFFLGVLICFNANTEAQQIFISGTIRDAETNMFISDVNVSLKGTKKGVTTNKNGFFSIRLSKTETQVLTISHVTYQSLRANLSKELLKGKDSIELNLKLTAKAIEMTGISISAERVKMLQSEVLDFEINDSLVFVIERSLGKPTLSVYTFYDQLIYRRFLPKECNTAFYTASGMLAFKKEGADFFYSFTYKGNDSYLTERIFDSVEQFARIAYYNLRNYYFYNQRLNSENPPDIFTILDRTSNIIFYTISSKWILRGFKHLLRVKNGRTELIYDYSIGAEWLLDRNTFYLNSNDLSALDLKYMNPYFPSMLSTAEEKSCLPFIAFIDNVQRGNQFTIDVYDQLASTIPPFWSVPAPVYFAKMQQALCIFNLKHGKIYHLDSTGLPFRFVNIDSVFLTNKSKDVITNQEQTQTYVYYIKSGTVTLREIDVMTGKQGKTIVLEHPFVEKIRIANNDIYYTYKDHTSRENDRRCLYKQRME